MFEALPKALLEIHTGMMASAILSDTIPCERLRIDDGDEEEEMDSVSTATSINHQQNIDIDNKTQSIKSFNIAFNFC